MSKNVRIQALGNGSEILLSYNTPVAAFIQGQGAFRTSAYWSVTTSKHINQWMERVGATKAETKPQWWFDELLQNAR